MPDNAQPSSPPFSGGEKGDSRRKLTVTHLRERSKAGPGAFRKEFRSRTGSRRVGERDRFSYPYTAGSEFPSEEELLKASGRIGTTIFHPIGTCRMGRENDESAVVDTKFRMRGLERL